MNPNHISGFHGHVIRLAVVVEYLRWLAYHMFNLTDTLNYSILYEMEFKAINIVIVPTAHRDLAPHL